MSSKIRFEITAGISLRKIESVRSLYAIGVLFLLVLIYVGLRDSASAMMRWFLLLFPYMFLFLSQDMIRSEVDSGSLENVLFIRERYRSYLLQKNAVVVLLGGALSLALFVILALVSLASKSIGWNECVGYGAGIIAGIYYVSLAGYFSYYVKGGSNVLLVILGQLALVITLIASSDHTRGIVDALDQGRIPDVLTGLKFAAITAIFPNIVSTQRYISWTIEPAILGLLLFFFQRLKASKFEVKGK